jgi:hypothetical protein
MTEPTTEASVLKDPNSIDNETRVDEFAVDIFRTLGQKTLLPETTVQMYNAFKLTKDKMQPGRLSPEWFAMIILLSDWADGRISFGGEPGEDGGASEE